MNKLTKEEFMKTTIPNIMFLGEKCCPSTEFEAPVLELIEENFRLYSFMKAPVPEEIEAYESNEKHFALYTFKSALFFLFKFGRLGWSSVPFSICLIPDLKKHFDVTQPVPNGIKDRWFVHQSLIDSNTGIVKTLSATTLCPKVSRALHLAILRQWEERETFTVEQYKNDVALAYRAFPTDKLMARSAHVKGKGGM